MDGDYNLTKPDSDATDYLGASRRACGFSLADHIKEAKSREDRQVFRVPGLLFPATWATRWDTFIWCSQMCAHLRFWFSKNPVTARFSGHSLDSASESKETFGAFGHHSPCDFLGMNFSTEIL